MAETLSTKLEVKRIAKTVTSRLIVLSSLWALWSFFYRYAEKKILPATIVNKKTAAPGALTWELISPSESARSPL